MKFRTLKKRGNTHFLDSLLDP
nr:hypothetical protein SYMBAF_100090 [Serratia symbiotica]